MMKENIQYWKVNEIPVKEVIAADKKRTLLAYTPYETYSLSPHHLFEEGDQICKDEYDTLIRISDIKTELAQLSVSSKREDKVRCKELETFIADYRTKQIHGFYQRIYLKEELADLKKAKKKTAQMQARIKEIEGYLKR